MRRCSLKFLVLLGVIGLCIFLDQSSKDIALTCLSSGDTLSITSFLNFVLRWNSGISFSLLSNNSLVTPQILLSFNSLIVVLLCIIMVRTKEFTVQFGFALVIGGAIGNIIDRVYHGAVIDFVDFHLNDWHFAVFNIADAFVSLGMILLIMGTYLKERRIA